MIRTNPVLCNVVAQDSCMGKESRGFLATFWNFLSARRIFLMRRLEWSSDEGGHRC
jgi:hypothetical protein